MYFKIIWIKNKAPTIFLIILTVIIINYTWVDSGLIFGFSINDVSDVPNSIYSKHYFQVTLILKYLGMLNIK